jgi:hypothetical protein
MPSKHHEVHKLNNTLPNITIVASGSSLLDMLNQQSDSTTVTFVENTRPCLKQVQTSKPNGKDSSTDNGKLSTLFNTTGRERNSTGPLKQWLYQHKDHPCMYNQYRIVFLF